MIFMHIKIIFILLILVIYRFYLQVLFHLIQVSYQVLRNVKFYLNIYPFISYKLKNTLVEDSLHSWENSYELRTIKTLKTYFPDKDIVISETGCKDYYESLAAPGVWSLSNFTPTEGKASNLMLEGMFKSSLGDYVTNVYWCYWDSIYFDKCGKVINYYNNGGEQYV